MSRLLILLAAALVAATTLTDHFSSPPIEVVVVRTDQWLFCRDYGVGVQIKALEAVTVSRVVVTAKFLPEETLRPDI